IRPRIELEEDIPLLDQGPFLEVDLLQVAPDVRPDLDGLHRGDAGGEVGVVGDLPLHGVTDRDRGRWGRRCLRGRPGAARRAETGPEHQGRTDAEAEAMSPENCRALIR